MAQNKELAVIEKKTLPTVEAIAKFEIKTEKDKEKASNWLSELKTALKKVEAWRKAKTDPINEALKVIRAETKPVEERLGEAIKEVSSKLTDYQTAEVAAADAEAERIANRIGDGKGKFTMETAGRKIDEIEKPTGAVATDKGVVKFAAKPVVDITPVVEMTEADLLKMQNQFLILAQEGLIIWDEVKVRKLILASKDSDQLPGVRYRVEQRPVNFS